MINECEVKAVTSCSVCNKNQAVLKCENCGALVCCSCSGLCCLNTKNWDDA